MKLLARFTPRERRAVSVAVVVITSTLVLKLVIKPSVAAVKDLNGIVIAERRSLSRELQLVATYGHKQVTPDVQSWRNDPARTLLRGFDQYTISSDFRRYLERLAKLSAVTIHHIQATGTAENAGIVTLSYSMTSESDYAGAVTFIRRLENGVLVRIREIELELVETASATTPEKLNITIALDAYGIPGRSSSPPQDYDRRAALKLAGAEARE